MPAQAAASRIAGFFRARPQRHVALILLAALLLASLLFRVHVSRACSLWLDEDYTHVDVARAWPVVLAGPEPWHPPLYFVLVKLALLPFGYSETALRSVSLGFGCVLLAGVYWLCLELGVKPLRALVVTAWLALTPFFMRHTIEARQYAVYPALGTVATACALRVLREPKRLDYFAVFALSAGGLAATHYFGLAYAVALSGALVVGLTTRTRELELTPARGAALVLTGAALLGVFVRVLGRAASLAEFYAKHKGRTGTMPWQHLLGSFVHDFAWLGDSSWGEYLQALFAGVGLVILTRSLRGVARWIPLGLTLAPCVGALFITSGHFVAPRYLAPSWVLYQIATGVALFAAADAVRRTSSKLGPKLGVALAGALVALPFALRLAEYPTDYGAGEDYYRGLQRYFTDRPMPNTALVVFPGGSGERMMDWEYPVGSLAIPLGRFHRRPGVDRYVVAEIHLADSRRGEFDRLATTTFGLSRSEWRALPYLDLPETKYQPAVRARLVVWDGTKVSAQPAPRRRGPVRRRLERTDPAEDD